MTQTTFVNSRGVVHKGSDVKHTVYPDVCDTPSATGPEPIPYPNIGQSSDTAKGPKSLTMDGQMPMVKGAVYSVSSGDEAGTAGGGITSGEIMSECEFMLYSFDVKFEGKNCCRIGDSLFHNKKNIMG